MEIKNFTVSPTIAAFMVLIVAVLGVGLVVTGYDIQTGGVTAQQALLPETVPSADDTDSASELTIHYPKGWQATPLGNGYVFNADTDNLTVQIVVDPRSFDQLISNYNPSRLVNKPDAYTNPLYSDLRGQSYTLTEGREPGQPEVLTDVVVLELPDGRSIEGRMTVNANAISRHRKTFGFMLQSLEVSLLPQITLDARDSLAPLPLTQTAENTGTVVNLSYPDGWMTEAVNDAGVYGLKVTSEDGTELLVFLLDPEITAAHLGVQTQEITPENILLGYQQTLAGSYVAQPTIAATFGETAGARLIARGEAGTLNAREFGVFEYADDLYLSYVLTANIANLQATIATADAILHSVQHNPLTLGNLPARGSIDPLAFASETATLASAGMTFSYPDGWTADVTRDPVIALIQGDAAPIQFLVGPPDLVVQAFNLPSMDTITPQAIADVLAESTHVAVPVSDYKVGGYTGVVFAIFGQMPPGQRPEAFNVVEVSILNLPTGDLLVGLISTEPSELPQLQATIDAIIASIQLEGIEASTEAEPDTTDVEGGTTEDEAATDGDETSQTGETAQIIG